MMRTWWLSLLAARGLGLEGRLAADDWGRMALLSVFWANPGKAGRGPIDLPHAR